MTTNLNQDIVVSKPVVFKATLKDSWEMNKNPIHPVLDSISKQIIERIMFCQPL